MEKEQLQGTQGMTQGQLRLMQLIQLELLLEVKRLCEKHGIAYSVIGGTQLGAVRHKGFIPWDDDADVGLLRDGYEAFRKACETDLDESRFYFQDAQNTKAYRWGYGKLRRKGTEFLREGQEEMPYGSGIFIDVFPLDNVPNGALAQKWHNLHCAFIRKLQWSYIGQTQEQSALLRFVYRQLAKISKESIFRHFNKFKNKYNARPCAQVRIISFPMPKGRPYECRTQWFQNRTEGTFEGYTFPIFADYKSYLRHKYGNWETPVSREALRYARFKLLGREEIQVNVAE